MKSETDTLTAIPGYQIKRALGRGGMATVYLALQESLNRHVALKVMNPLLVAERNFQQRFLNEGHIIGQLSHPHIVTIYDIGVHEHYYYLSMEYLPGGTLRDKIHQGLALDRAVKIAKILGTALGYAHRRGFIHRDIKPLNVLFRDDGSPVVTDFGIAKALGTTTQLTATGFAFGSIGYMSPEQALGKPIDNRADIYSLGVMFWEMLTGNTPYASDDAFALALKHATAPLPELPPHLAQFQPIASKMLAKQPSDRYATAEEFVAELDRVMPDRGKSPTAASADTDITLLKTPISAPTATLIIPPERGANAALGIGLVLGIVLVLGAGAYFGSPQLQPWVTALISGQATEDDPQALRQAEEARKAEEARRAAEAQRLAEQKRQADEAAARQADADRRAKEEATRQAELKRQQDEEAARQAELKRQQDEETARQAEADRKAEKARQAELKRRQDEEAARQAAARKAAADRKAELNRQAGSARQAELKRLLARADSQWQVGRYSDPPGDNAFETYNQVRNLDPGNQEAQAKLLEVGKLGLAAQYRQEAEQLLAAGSVQNGLAKIAEGLRFAPTDGALLALKTRAQAQIDQTTATERKQTDIASLLAKAEAQLQSGKFTEPAGDNAYESYRNVMDLDPVNAKAREGLLKIGRISLGDRYQREAAQLIDAGNLQAGLAKAEEGLRLAPDHTGLQALRTQLQARLKSTQ